MKCISRDGNKAVAEFKNGRPLNLDLKKVSASGSARWEGAKTHNDRPLRFRVNDDVRVRMDPSSPWCCGIIIKRRGLNYKVGYFEDGHDTMQYYYWHDDDRFLIQRCHCDDE